jgi:hypothetical protein
MITTNNRIPGLAANIGGFRTFDSRFTGCKKLLSRGSLLIVTARLLIQLNETFS